MTEIRVRHGKEEKLVSLIGPIRMCLSLTNSPFSERCQGIETVLSCLSWCPARAFLEVPAIPDWFLFPVLIWASSQTN